MLALDEHFVAASRNVRNLVSAIVICRRRPPGADQQDHGTMDRLAVGLDHDTTAHGSGGRLCRGRYPASAG
jgi:hypothetical protein